MALTKYTEARPTRGTFGPSSLWRIGFRSPSLSCLELLIQFSETSLTTFLLILTHISRRNPYLDRLLGWNECILRGRRGLGTQVGSRLGLGILGGVIRPAHGWHHAQVAGDGGKVEAKVSIITHHNGEHSTFKVHTTYCIRLPTATGA